MLDHFCPNRHRNSLTRNTLHVYPPSPATAIRTPILWKIAVVTRRVISSTSFGSACTSGTETGMPFIGAPQLTQFGILGELPTWHTGHDCVMAGVACMTGFFPLRSKTFLLASVTSASRCTWIILMSCWPFRFRLSFRR